MRKGLSPCHLRPAHLALGVTFVAFGALDGTWAARLPALKHRLRLDSAGLTDAAFAPSFATLLVAVCVLGAGWGVADVSANAHGVALEERLGRPILSVLHGMWSFGLLAGSGIAAGAAAAAISPRLQFPVVVAAVLVLVAIFVPRLLSGTAADVDSANFALPRGALALPAFLTFCALFIEFGAMN